MQASSASETTEKALAEPASLSFERLDNGTLVVRISGSWRVANGVPGLSDVQAQSESGSPISRVEFDTDDLEAWDTGLLIFLRSLRNHFAHQQIKVDSSGLPEGARRLLILAAAVPEKKDIGKGVKRTTFLGQVGSETIHAVTSTVDMVRFVGEATIAIINAEALVCDKTTRAAASADYETQEAVKFKEDK